MPKIVDCTTASEFHATIARLVDSFHDAILAYDTIDNRAIVEAARHVLAEALSGIRNKDGRPMSACLDEFFPSLTESIREDVIEFEGAMPPLPKGARAH